MTRLFLPPFALMLLVASPLWAQPVAGPQEGVAFTLNTGVSHMVDTDIDGGGEFNATRASVGLGMRFGIDQDLSANIGLGYQADIYDFSTLNGLAAAEPWDTIHSVRLRALFNYQIDEEWSLTGGPIFTFSGESDADADDSFTAGGMIAVGHKFSDDLSVTLGVVVMDQLEDDVAVFPVLVFNWAIDEQWTLRSGSFDLGSGGGAGVELVWAADETLSIGGGFQYQTRRFRLDDDPVAPNGVGEETMLPIYVRLTWTPEEAISVSGFVGAALAGELLLENSNGSKLGEQDFDPAPIFGGRVTFRF